jgi:hypothetical protein
MKTDKRQSWLMSSLCACSITATLGVTGCQVSVGGQTLPSPYYLADDVQYFAPGTEFKLSAEAAAQKAYQADQELQNP